MVFPVIVPVFFREPSEKKERGMAQAVSFADDFCFPDEGLSFEEIEKLRLRPKRPYAVR